MTVETLRPEVPLRLITPADVRASIRRATRSLEKAAEEIVWQVEMEAWRTLGYSSWNAMREAEYGDAAFMVPKKDRPELVGRMRRAGLTQQEIADTAGVTERTVRSDLSTGNFSGSDRKQSPITNSRGQQRPAAYVRQVVEDDEPEYITYARTDGGERVDTATGEITPDEETDPVPAESVITATCPTCHGTGKVTR